MSWTAQLIAAGILGQTLFFKFTGAPEAVALFEQLGVEPWGRWTVGIFELIAVVLLVIPRTAVFGGLLGIGLMVGAIGGHLTKIGIVVNDDGGTLFAMALIVLAMSVTVVAIRRQQLFGLLREITGGGA